MAMAELKKLFDVLEINPALLDNPNDRDEGVKQLLKKAQDTSNAAVLANQKLNNGFELWNEPLVDAQHLIAMQKACAAVKDEFSNYSARFNTPANLKVCYELTPTELETTHICPHCHYNLGDQVLNVAGQLDNLDIRISDLVTEWTQTLLNTISDPTVASQKEYLSAEQQKAIDDFYCIRYFAEAC